VRHNPSTDDFSRRAREKIKIKKKRPYISRISPGAPLQPIGTNFWLRVRLVDVINCAKFYRNRLRGLDSVRGLSLTIPIGLRYRRYIYI